MDVISKLPLPISIITWQRTQQWCNPGKLFCYLKTKPRIWKVLSSNQIQFIKLYIYSTPLFIRPMHTYSWVVVVMVTQVDGFVSELNSLFPLATLFRARFLHRFRLLQKKTNKQNSTNIVRFGTIITKTALLIAESKDICWK